MFPIQKKRPCSGHCLFGRLITVSSWSWLQYLFSRTTSQYTSVVIYISVIFNYLYIYVYIYIHTYTLHYITLHYITFQCNTMTVHLHYTKLHYITLHCNVHTSQSPSNCADKTMVRHVQALCLGSIQYFLQTLLECRLGSLQDAFKVSFKWFLQVNFWFLQGSFHLGSKQKRIKQKNQNFMQSFSGIRSGFAFLKDLHLLKVFFRVSLRFLSNFMQGLLQEFFQVFRGRLWGAAVVSMLF